MSAFALRLAAAGTALVGSPYRFRGRDPATGIDCIGLILCAMERAGRPAIDLPHYALRNLSVEPYLAFAARNGFGPCRGQMCGGDVLLVRTGPAQHHLVLVLSKDRFAHAHLGARKVIVQHALQPWAVVAHWRPSEQE